MQIDEHRGSGLAYLTIEPDGYESERRYPLIVLLHGFGASMRDLAGLCQAIDTTGFVYACPNAPISMEFGPGAVGYAWAPIDGEGSERAYEYAEQLLVQFMDEVTSRYGVDRGQVLFGGFSQGGMMAYRYGLTRTDAVGGIFALSSRVPSIETWQDRLSARRELPIFVAHGTQDTLIGVDEARGSVELLRSEGYSPDYREYEMGHEISQKVLDDLVPWVHKNMTPMRRE